MRLQVSPHYDLFTWIMSDATKIKFDVIEKHLKLEVICVNWNYVIKKLHMQSLIF